MKKKITSLLLLPAIIGLLAIGTASCAIPPVKKPDVNKPDKGTQTTSTSNTSTVTKGTSKSTTQQVIKGTLGNDSTFNTDSTGIVPKRP